MSADFPPIPPAVIEFAEKNNIVDVLPTVYLRAFTEAPLDYYKGYNVYEGYAKENQDKLYTILEKEGKVRFATAEDL